MKLKYESEILQVMHEDMMGMHRAGIISDAEMRKFDKMCLVQEPETTHPTENSLKIDRTTPVAASVRRNI